MNVVRLARTSFPGPAHRELRQKSVFASRGRNMGTVENLYVEEDSRDMPFVDVVTNGFLGLGRRNHLVPVEAVSEQDPGWITLGVAQETVERAPIFPNPRFGANEDYQVRSPNFGEPRRREVRRIYLPRTRVNRTYRGAYVLHTSDHFSLFTCRSGVKGVLSWVQSADDT